MAPRFVQLQGYTREDRNEMVRRAEDAISSAGGWLVDANFASNKSAVLRFEVPQGGAEALRAALLATGLKLDEASLATLESLSGAAREAQTPRDVGGTLALFFVHDEPDLRRVIPAVPG
ncbi:hypothetical protein P2318_34020 [Myxococcaceae bacterium GXIMD 01537]